MTTKRTRKKKAKRMPATKRAQSLRSPRPTRDRPPVEITGDEPDPAVWVTPGVAEGDRDTVERDLADRDRLND